MPEGLRGPSALSSVGRRGKDLTRYRSFPLPIGAWWIFTSRVLVSEQAELVSLSHLELSIRGTRHS
jgi:hypothetical protein